MSPCCKFMKLRRKNKIAECQLPWRSGCQLPIRIDTNTYMPQSPSKMYRQFSWQTKGNLSYNYSPNADVMVKSLPKIPPTQATSPNAAAKKPSKTPWKLEAMREERWYLAVSSKTKKKYLKDCSFQSLRGALSIACSGVSKPANQCIMQLCIEAQWHKDENEDKPVASAVRIRSNDTWTVSDVQHNCSQCLQLHTLYSAENTVD